MQFFFLQDENHVSNHLNNIYIVLYNIILYYVKKYLGIHLRFELHCFQKDENHKSDNWIILLYYIILYYIILYYI